MASPTRLWEVETVAFLRSRPASGYDRLSPTGNRQLNAALHRIAITQARYHQLAREFLIRRRASGNSTTESLRALKRRLSDVIYHALLADV